MNDIFLLRKKLNSLATKERAKVNAWFFKTGPGEYGEGDQFIGVTVPQIRIVAKEFDDISLSDVEKLLESPIHEERLLAVIILVGQYKKADTEKRKKIYNFYLSHSGYINNWDLVDTSAEYIVGAFLDGKGIAVLNKLAVSKNTWERRIAMLSTFHFVKQQRHTEAFTIAEILLHDQHDLIHKAVGWMLREIGKKCGEDIEEEFLLKHYKTMPRTMLRYAIERFPDSKKKFYMTK